MTREDLQKKFNIIGTNTRISLYRKKGEYTRGLGYCGDITLKNRKAIFNGKSYADIESLDAALREWENSLPWPVDTYNPMLRKSAALVDRLAWFLTDKMGFELSHENWETKYVKTIGPSFRLEFTLENKLRTGEGEYEDTVTIATQYGKMYFTQDVEDVDTGVGIISTLVKSTVLTMSSDMVNLLAACPDVVVPEIKAYVENKASFFGWEKADFKTIMIKLLEEQLDKLKA